MEWILPRCIPPMEYTKLAFSHPPSETWDEKLPLHFYNLPSEPVSVSSHRGDRIASVIISIGVQKEMCWFMQDHLIGCIRMQRSGDESSVLVLVRGPALCPTPGHLSRLTNKQYLTGSFDTARHPKRPRNMRLGYTRHIGRRMRHWSLS